MLVHAASVGAPGPAFGNVPRAARIRATATSMHASMSSVRTWSRRRQFAAVVDPDHEKGEVEAERGSRTDRGGNDGCDQTASTEAVYW